MRSPGQIPNHILVVWGLVFLVSITWLSALGAGAIPQQVTSLSLYLPLLNINHPHSVSGIVVDENGPLSGAIVRVRATENKTTSAFNGTFTLTGLTAGVPVSVTAWVDGYYVGWSSATPPSEAVKITLKPYYTTDNANYDWFSHEGDPGSLSCSHCMPCYTEWQADAHSDAAVNPRFLTMYNGTDVHGNQSPPTDQICVPDYGCIPLPPDLTQPYYGPGYKLDFPDTAGNCATCHAPADAAIPGMAYSVDISDLSDIAQEGVFCEF